VAGLGQIALNSAPVFGGAMLAIAAGQFRGPNYRGLIKEDMDLRDRLPPALNPFGLTAKAPRKRPDAVMPRYSQSATAARRHPT